MPNNEDIRQTKRIVIIGTNGTGKTTLLHRIVHSAAQKTLIITPHDMEWNETDPNGVPLYPVNELRTAADYNFTGIQKHVFDPDRTLKRLRGFTRGLLVFDDCRAYLDARTDKEIHRILISSRQNMIDEIFVAHGFTEVPPKVFTFATEYFLFRTEDNITRRKFFVLNYPLIEKMQRKVNKASVYNPHHYEHFKL